MAKTPTGASRKYVPKKCHAGHDIVRVKVVPVKGRSRFEWRCANENGFMVECLS